MLIISIVYLEKRFLMKDKWIELGLFALILVILAVILNFRQIVQYLMLIL